jgi:prevent-host-death family protein
MTMIQSNDMTMKKVNIYEAKARLSEYLDAVAAGERVVICKRNRPVAELMRVGAARVEPRPIGGARGRLTVPETFFDPLPDELVDAFSAGAYPTTSAADRVAERAPRRAGATPSRRRTRR